MKKKKINRTKEEIVKVAIKLFFSKGFSNTSAREISEALDISPGNLTFHFHTKEDLLAVIVDFMCSYQWELMKTATKEGKTALMAYALELLSMAAACEENEIARDLYLSSYTHAKPLEIIRKNDKEKAKIIFEEYTSGWTEEQFKEAETLISGIEYATLMTTQSSSSLEVRIPGALNAIMLIFGVPEDIRKVKIEKVTAMDYREIGNRILHEFMDHLENLSKEEIDDVLRKYSE
ncbi:MAG: TetR/AcrR family transcriptional regulator [Clostridia bacterium]|nr:TetR/AcrR family transcriptional regulator [Clostridia bacterium]